LYICSIESTKHGLKSHISVSLTGPWFLVSISILAFINQHYRVNILSGTLKPDKILLDISQNWAIFETMLSSLRRTISPFPQVKVSSLSMSFHHKLENIFQLAQA